jgi:hypothetical protein
MLLDDTNTLVKPVRLALLVGTSKGQQPPGYKETRRLLCACIGRECRKQ